ncbi:MAG: bifunctional tetrahydrofolate synthase/dihydrofolate synthase [Dokdonella sp.]
MSPTTLADWLDHQQRVHPREIELGLDRVRAVWQRLGAPALAPVVITVGGTNGKGSTVAFLEAMLAADGKRVGAFTSPHLLRYNERVRVVGDNVDDATLIDAFEHIEAVRDDIALTYFEYGTLAALWIFSRNALDVALLEVGLGGRLDAVNLIDADAAIVTTVDLDHQDWLGLDLDSIGREKAGIFRAGRAAIVGDARAPRGLLDEGARIGADVRMAGRDFCCVAQPDAWYWSGWPQRRSDAIPAAIPLPKPTLAAPCQIDNAAAAIGALHALRERLGWNPAAIARGVAQAKVDARLQRFGGETALVIDVAHNPQAARVLATWLLTARVEGRTFAVFGALRDKDVRGVVEALAAQIDVWLFAGLERDSPRGLDASGLRDAAGAALDARVAYSLHADVALALAAAFALAQPGDRVIAFGSFFVAAAALEFAAQQQLGAA